jgi:hypothetical protein
MSGRFLIFFKWLTTVKTEELGISRFKSLGTSSSSSFVFFCKLIILFFTTVFLFVFSTVSFSSCGAFFHTLKYLFNVVLSIFWSKFLIIIFFFLTTLVFGALRRVYTDVLGTSSTGASLSLTTTSIFGIS